MKNKNKNYYDNGTEFHFISNVGEHLGKRLKALNKIIFGVIEAKPYDLDWEDILGKYRLYIKDYGVIDTSEFAYNYVMGYALLNNFSEDEAMKEAMYVHLNAELVVKKLNKELPN